MDNIKKILKEYFKTYGEIDESIVVVTTVFLLVVVTVVVYAFIWHSDIPQGVVNVLQYLWGGTVGAYVGKHVARVGMNIFLNKSLNNNQ